jgi:hypothetical protein
VRAGRRGGGRGIDVKGNPRRELAWRELHARPNVRFTAPAHVLYLVVRRRFRNDMPLTQRLE